MRLQAALGLAGLCLAAACGPQGGVVLGFWLEPVVYQSPRIGEPIAASELATIDRIARTEIANAFSDYDVTVNADHRARYTVAVLPKLNDDRLLRQGTNAGESRAISGFGGSGAVNFEYVANGAMVFAPESARWMVASA